MLAYPLEARKDVKDSLNWRFSTIQSLSISASSKETKGPGKLTGITRPNVVDSQNAIRRAVTAPAVTLEDGATGFTSMVHKVLHQGTQLPAYNTIDVAAVLWENAYRSSSIDVVRSCFQASDVFAIVELFVGVGSANKAFQALHRVAIVACIRGLAIESVADPTAVAIDALRRSNVRQQTEG